MSPLRGLGVGTSHRIDRTGPAGGGCLARQRRCAVPCGLPCCLCRVQGGARESERPDSATAPLYVGGSTAPGTRSAICVDAVLSPARRGRGTDGRAPSPVPMTRTRRPRPRVTRRPSERAQIFASIRKELSEEGSSGKSRILFWVISIVQQRCRASRSMLLRSPSFHCVGISQKFPHMNFSVPAISVREFLNLEP